MLDSALKSVLSFLADLRALQTDNMTNRDLIPMPPNRRTYHIWSYCVYWCISGLCISAYTLGSSLLAYGLNCKQALGAIAIGAICVAPLVVACGWMGAQHRIGFTVASRFTWGVRGFYFPVIIRTFTTIFWDGLQGTVKCFPARRWIVLTFHTDYSILGRSERRMLPWRHVFELPQHGHHLGRRCTSLERFGRHAVSVHSNT